MVKMPKLKWYSVKDLANEWKTEPSRIKGLIEEGDLKAATMYLHYKSDEVAYIEYGREVDEREISTAGFTKDNGLHVSLAEVERYEKEHGWEPRSAPQVEVESPKPQRSRNGVKNRMTQAIEETRLRLKKRLGKEPSADEVFTSLKKQEDPTGVVVDSNMKDGKHYLVWEDLDGKSHDIQYRTVANKLSIIRKYYGRL